MYNSNIVAQLPDKQKYDPWVNQQNITDVRISIHCSRYWMLSEWECERMSYPFWRLYHSRTGGGFIHYENKTIEIGNNELIVIPPYTSFSSYLHTPSKGATDRIAGEKIIDENSISQYQQKHYVDQLFVHFNLGFPFDNASKGIYRVHLNNEWMLSTLHIERRIIEQPNEISFDLALGINALLTYCLFSLSKQLWSAQIIDARIEQLLVYIDQNLSEKLSNEHLSDKLSMAQNSFARLFRNEMKCSVQAYIQQKRIEKAIMLLHHRKGDIDDIAMACGFYDRFHFSKIFKKITGQSPALYKRKYVPR